MRKIASLEFAALSLMEIIRKENVIGPFDNAADTLNALKTAKI